MASTQHRVSVIVPCHNYAAFLPEALDSIFSQSVPVHEVIVIDDGSTDDTAAVAAAYRPAVTLIRQAQSGISGGRNAGLRIATGDFIAFLDADDIWPPQSLEARLAHFAAAPETEAVFGLVEHFICPRLDAETMAHLHCPPGQQPVRLASGMLVRHDTIKRVGPFDLQLKVGEMIDWTARLTADGAPAAMINQLVLRRRIHGANTVLKESVKSDYLRALRAAIHRRAGQEPG